MYRENKPNYMIIIIFVLREPRKKKSCPEMCIEPRTPIYFYYSRQIRSKKTKIFIALNLFKITVVGIMGSYRCTVLFLDIFILQLQMII